MKFKKTIIGMLLAVSVFSMVGCDELDQGSEKETNSQQEQLLEESNRQAGMQSVKNYFEKKLAKDIIMKKTTSSQIVFTLFSQKIFTGFCK